MLEEEDERQTQQIMYILNALEKDIDEDDELNEDGSMSDVNTSLSSHKFS